MGGVPTSPQTQLSMAPPVSFEPFRGATHTVQYMIAAAKGPRGERSTLLRSLTERVVRELQPKDYLSEILAIRDFVATRVRYLNDPISTEWIKDPQRLAEEILAYGKTASDCEEMAALIAAMVRQCGREAEYVIVGFGRPGHYSHTFTRVKEPKSKRWIVCDPVAGTEEGKMLRRVKTYKVFKID